MLNFFQSFNELWLNLRIGTLPKSKFSILWWTAWIYSTCICEKECMIITARYFFHKVAFKTENHCWSINEKLSLAYSKLTLAIASPRINKTLVLNCHTIFGTCSNEGDASILFDIKERYNRRESLRWDVRYYDWNAFFPFIFILITDLSVSTTMLSHLITSPNVHFTCIR